MGNLTSQSVLIFVDFNESLHKALKLQGPFSIGLTPKQSMGHVIFKPSMGPTAALHLTLTAWIWILLEAFGRGKCILSVVGRFKEDITVKTSIKAGTLSSCFLVVSSGNPTLRGFPTL